MLKWLLPVMLLIAPVARAASYVIVVPDHMSPSAQEGAQGLIMGAIGRLKTGDNFTLYDAGHLAVVAEMMTPDLPVAPKGRARALAPLLGKINQFLGEPADEASANNLNIPATLRELGTNVIPKLKDKDIHIMMVGSIVWFSPKETNDTWSFKDKLPSDGFFTRNAGSFGIGAQETILAGTLVSICFSDKIDDFPREGFRRAIMEFWGKSIVGRGGKVGAIVPYSSACTDRLFASDEDPTPYVIDRNEDLFLRTPKWITVPVR
jgi:hypothetical protein